MRLFPWIHATQEGLRFGYQLLYLLDSSPFYTPVLHLLGQNIVRVSGQEMVSHAGTFGCIFAVVVVTPVFEAVFFRAVADSALQHVPPLSEQLFSLL